MPSLEETVKPFEQLMVKMFSLKATVNMKELTMDHLLKAHEAATQTSNHMDEFLEDASHPLIAWPREVKRYADEVADVFAIRIANFKS